MTIDDYRHHALLAIAIATLRKELLPALPADKRYTGAMVANALEIAARDVDASLDEARAELFGALDRRFAHDTPLIAQCIRSGDFPLDGQPLLALLKRDLEAELSVRNPRFLVSRGAEPKLPKQSSRAIRRP
jgi:hypothetical protein